LTDLGNAQGLTLHHDGHAGDPVIRDAARGRLRAWFPFSPFARVLVALRFGFVVEVVCGRVILRVITRVAQINRRDAAAASPRRPPVVRCFLRHRVVV
jgi:hypothetical protein|tara:strand:- start:48 stop:341 length:294 start_codon:yes stop_codon:yes gene_type:complete